MDHCIELNNVNKHFGGKHVVKDLTIRIPTGKITGFLGPNGSGKTTSMICAFSSDATACCFTLTLEESHSGSMR